MPTEHDLIKWHQGEAVEILFSAKNPDASILTDPESHTIQMTISTSEDGEALLSFDSVPIVSLVDIANADFFIQIPDAQLSVLREGVTYYYNIWSQIDPEDPRLQAYGKLRRKGSIGFVV